MKLVFTHPNPMIVGNARGLLEAAGIEVALRNEYAQGAVGELAVFDSWPELWVLHEADHARARALLRDALDSDGAGEWDCRRCGEHNAGSFEICWQCGAAVAGD